MERWFQRRGDGRNFSELEGLVGIRRFDSENRGVIAARNAAFSEARGEFICCLDADDLIEPTYLEKAVLFLDEHPDVAIAYSWVRCLATSRSNGVCPI